MTEAQYIIDVQSEYERYLRICQIITALENQQIAAVSKSDISEYELNDGQIRIKTAYRSPEAIAKAITDYERIKNRIVQKVTGTSIIALRDAETIQSYGRRTR